MSNKHDNVKANRCPFCRERWPNEGESDKRLMKRIKANDPAALSQMTAECYSKGDRDIALEYWTKAAELGDLNAHQKLGYMYMKGLVVEKDEEKTVYHLEKAAIGGHPKARHNLGCKEANNGMFERAKKHWIIAANLGLHESLKALRLLYANGCASKEDYADALRAYQAAVDATKSPERERAEEVMK